jgi:hypothetical protein
MTVAEAENLKKIYGRYLNRLMAWKGSYAVNFNRQYEDAELLEITPDDVASFLKVLAYGTAQPGPTDFPTECRSSNLNQAKKAISYFMPHRDSPWNVQAKFGNPTRSKVVNDVIRDVKKHEVRKEGKESQARRDMKRPEYRKTLRLIESRDALGPCDKIRFSTMLKFQFHIIGRSDDICNLETRDLRSHDKFGDFALSTKVSWSKNVLEERDCPEQILLGSNDTDFCVLLGALACWLESRFTCAHGDPHYLFGMREEPNEPKKAKGAYRYTLDKVWKVQEFIDLLQQVRGKVRTHSLRKFPATWASKHGATDPKIEIRGRWKGSPPIHIC